MIKTTIDVRMLEEIESALAIDIYDRDVVVTLAARVEEHEQAHTDPECDAELQAAIRAELDGGWLHLDEVYAIIRLRGWHRTSAGRITVDAGALFDVRRVLGNLTLSLGSECEETIQELDYPGNEDLLGAALKSMRDTGYCGECLWCQVSRLYHECGRELYNAGHEMGIEYRMYALGQSCAQANWEVYGYCTGCNTWNNTCADPDHRAA